MLKSAIVKFSNLLRYIVQSVLLLILSFSRTEVNPKTLLIVRLDAIGDYILLRNFVRLLKEIGRYKEYKITLCGNISWKELAESLDSDRVDNFIWLDRKKFKNNLIYKYRLLKFIRFLGFETAVDLTYSREILYGDSIIKASNAIQRIGSEGSLDAYVKWKRKLFSDSYYTKLIPASVKNLFEFYRNKEFFQILLETDLDIHQLSIDVSGLHFDSLPDKEFAVIFPGAGEPEKIWDVNYFINIAEYLKSEYSLNIIVCGSRNEKDRADKIISALGKEIIDLTGKTTLSQLAKVIRSAKILIANDTSAIHFAAAVNTPFICISNGKRFGRFHPYPGDVFSHGYFIYPPEIMNQLQDTDTLNEKFRFNSDLNINEIAPETVKTLIKNILS